jgi:hypothetical protein
VQHENGKNDRKNTGKAMKYQFKLFASNAIFVCRYSGLAVIYSVLKTMQLLQLLNEVFLFMHGKEKQMKSISGALNKHWCSTMDRYT